MTTSQLEGVFISIALVLVLFGLFSRKLNSWGISPPMTFVACGCIIAAAHGTVAHVLGELTIIQLIAQLALILILFTDASHINLKKALHNRIPIRLLLIGLPLTILFGIVGAYYLIPGIKLLEAAFIAILLTPTDAALGKEVVTSHKVPFFVREGLNIESGLNDGLVLPFLISALALSDHHKMVSHWEYGVLIALGKIGLGVVIGSVTGWIAGLCIEKSVRAQGMLPVYQRLMAVGIALLSYTLADFLHGNGFIATFCAGVTLGLETKHVKQRLISFGETEGEQLSLIIFLIFGASFLPAVWGLWNWNMLLYALLSLTIIRMLPVALAMIGARQRWETTLFLGWFGPRGIASILFGIILVKNSPGIQDRAILSVVFLTVFISVFTHGLSARYGTDVYLRHLKA